MTTIPKLGKQWSVALDFKPAVAGDIDYNIIRLGKRFLVIDRKYISIVINGLLEWQPVELKLADWTNIKIIQQVIKGKVMVVILIEGKQMFCMKNTNPMDFYNAPVYASYTGGNHTKGYIRNLIIKTGKC